MRFYNKLRKGMLTSSDASTVLLFNIPHDLLRMVCTFRIPGTHDDPSVLRIWPDGVDDFLQLVNTLAWIIWWWESEYITSRCINKPLMVIKHSILWNAQFVLFHILIICSCSQWCDKTIKMIKLSTSYTFFENVSLKGPLKIACNITEPDSL